MSEETSPSDNPVPPDAAPPKPCEVCGGTGRAQDAGAAGDAGDAGDCPFCVGTGVLVPRIAAGAGEARVSRGLLGVIAAVQALGDAPPGPMSTERLLEIEQQMRTLVDVQHLKGGLFGWLRELIVEVKRVRGL